MVHPPFLLQRHRVKEKDDFDWRSDPLQPETNCLVVGGYKSIKHRWLAMYEDQQREEREQKKAERERRATQLQVPLRLPMGCGSRV